MSRIIAVSLILILAGLYVDSSAKADDKSDVEDLLNSQVTAWNEGNLDGFMAGYWRDDQLRFASGGSLTFGWQQTYENYTHYFANEDEKPRLAFNEIDIKLLSPDKAMAFGMWRLMWSDKEDSWGQFTLILNKFPEGWRIIHDHTSSALE